jgi:FkbH-like protein
MFEFDKYNKKSGFTHASPEISYTPFEGARARAFLLWGEHCIECAAPDCFSTCDLYQPRPDRRCRRFDYGVYRNAAFPSAAGYGGEVIFKRWGKLEARGNAMVMRPGMVRFLEACVSLGAPLLNRVGALAGRLSGDIRWSYLTHSLLERFNFWLLRRRRPDALPDAFVIEIYNPGLADAVLLFSMAVDRTKVPGAVAPGDLPRPVLRKLVVPPGHFREDLPRSSFGDLIASNLPFNLAITPEAVEGTHLVFLSLDFVRFKSAARGRIPAAGADRRRPNAKCVIFDLDDTLWRGVLLEGEVELAPKVETMLRRLDERGILVSVASKNAHDDAMERLREFSIADYLLHPAIGWSTKSEGVRQIARDLDIGLDSLIFVDDSAFERDEVARALPEVEVLPASCIADLLDHPRLQGSVTEESRARRQMYRQAAIRQSAAAEYGESYVDFLRSCDIRVDVRPDAPEDFERLAELVQRTNQLNFSGRKYRRDELETLMLDPTLERHVIECADKYGSYGIVGLCLARRVDDGVRIDDLMLSCRVQGKFIEKALLHHLCTRPGWCASSVEIAFKPTDRNAAARAVLSELGFPSGGEGLLRIEVRPGQFHPKFMTVIGTHDVQRVIWNATRG